MRGNMTISDVLRAIKKHWVVGILLFCAVAGVVAGKTFTTAPVYTTSTEILAQSSSSLSSEDTTATGQQYPNGTSLTTLYPNLVQSDEVLQSTIDNLGFTLRHRSCAPTFRRVQRHLVHCLYLCHGFRSETNRAYRQRAWRAAGEAADAMAGAGANVPLSLSSAGGT